MKFCIGCNRILDNFKYATLTRCPECGNRLKKYYESNSINEIVTHNGKMHTDDVCSIAILLILFPDAKIIRSRSETFLASKEKRLIVDVGNQYSPKNGLFDHHQMKMKRRVGNTDIYYSAMGLIWEEFGHQIIRTIAKENKLEIISNKLIPDLYSLILHRIIVPIDISDTTGNGFNNMKDNNLISIQTLINDFNGTENTDEKFKFVSDFFKRWISEFIKTSLTSRIMEIQFEKDFDEAIKNNQNYCVLSKVGNWIRCLTGSKNCDKYKNILFVVYHDVITNGWKIQGAPIECSNRAVRMKIPHNAIKYNGISFVHENQFIAEASSLECAINMIKEITKNK